MNDLAADLLAATPGPPLTVDLAPALRDLVTAGLVVSGNGVVIFARHAPAAANAPGNSGTLTGWEADTNSFHLDETVPVTVDRTGDGEPVISPTDQALMLRHGLGFAWQLARLAAELPEPVDLRCIISANSTNGTFRLHRLRDGEPWISEALDEYRLEEIIVLDASARGRN
jgi:hypothetical protein